MVDGNRLIYLHILKTRRENSNHRAIMLLSPHLLVDQAKIMMTQDHQAYKTNLMKKHERDRSVFECQFLCQYLASHGDIGTPHGRALHWIEQDLTNHSERVMHMGPRHQNSRDIRHLQEKIEEQTRSIVGPSRSHRKLPHGARTLHQSKRAQQNQATKNAKANPRTKSIIRRTVKKPQAPDKQYGIPSTT